ncbi:MAG: TPM domain-containing protein, partial [Fuerstia sp.]|nr:TPM domain-containing protein [Fuerstiella sp.]
MHFFNTLLAAACLVVAANARMACGQSEMPDFTGERLTFSGVDSAAWQSLPAVIADLEKTGTQTYYVVVVQSSGDGPTATRDYTDRLYEHWVQQAARNGLPLDTQRSVLVVLATQNRQLSVHAGQSLLQSYGMNAQTIDQQLVQPHFIPYAKAGNYPEGVRILLTQINDRILAHDASVAQQVTVSQQPAAITPASQVPESTAAEPAADQKPLVKTPTTVVPTEAHAMQEAPPSRPLSVLSSPTTIAGTAMIIGMLTLLILRWLHLRVRRPLQAQMQAYRQHVVQLSDDIDALCERHRMLPFTDKDYKEPMLGETLSMYDGIQKSLEQLRQRWLELMDVWDKVDTLSKHEHYFGRSRLREAAAMLQQVPVNEVESTLNNQCVKALDRLEDAHEQVVRLDTSLTESLQRVQQQLAQLQTLQLSVEPYQASLEKVAELRVSAARIVVPDPIGSQSIQTAAGELLRSVGQLTERILQHRRGMDELSDKLAETSAWLKSLRNGGMKFCEDDSDPSPLFPTIQHHCDECLKLLNLGEAETAAEHLKQGFALAAKAQSAIQLQVDSKEFCHREIPIRTTEQRQLDAQSKSLEPVLRALETEFAAASWSNVANLRSSVSDAVLHGNTVLSDATLAGSDTVQHFQKAAEALRQLKQLQDETTVLIASGEQRLQQLRQLRSETTAELNQLQQERSRVASLLQSSGADRAAANRRFQDTESALQAQIQAAARSRADWPQIAESLTSVRREFSTAEQMAREDIRLAEQAAQEILNAQRELRQAESFYRAGFKADVSAVSRQLQEAQQALNSQKYERAIELANSVISASRQELRMAQSAADAAEQRREQER